ncbi:MAG: hypothetical protein QM778_20685 [Myxococcales bacterium]
MRRGANTATRGLAGSLVVLVLLSGGARAFGQEGEAEVEEDSASAAAPELLDDDTSRTIAELTRRAAALEERGNLPPEVRGPLSGVKLALDAMRQAWARRDMSGAQRTEGLARAGLALAERRYSLMLERELMRAAEARREAARTRLQSAQAARAAEAERLRTLTTPVAPAAVGPNP